MKVHLVVTGSDQGLKNHIRGVEVKMNLAFTGLSRESPNLGVLKEMKLNLDCSAAGFIAPNANNILVEVENVNPRLPSRKLRLPSRKPRLLISYVYYKSIEKYLPRIYCESWILDSGAFTAWNAGKSIQLSEYIDFCKRVKESARPPEEIYGLDDIQDWKKTNTNVKEMWKVGIEAIPTYHVGEPPDVLRGYVKDYPKVALGGMVRKHSNVKEKFLNLAFAIGWPKKFHAFGLDVERLLLKYPIHSADSSNWVSKPCIFGSWSKYGKLTWRGSDQDLRSEIERIFAIEDKANAIFKRELAILG